MPNGSDLGSISPSSSLSDALGETNMINPLRSHSLAGRLMPVNPQPHNVMCQWYGTTIPIVLFRDITYLLPILNPSLLTMDN